VTVSAAVAVADPTTNPFGEISGLQILVMGAISTLSGVTALTLRIDAELGRHKSKSLPRPILFASSHMLGSWLAGVLSFAISQHLILGIWWQIGFIIVASFTGAKFVERMSELYSVKIIKRELQ
jgi:VanZ family protein